MLVRPTVFVALVGVNTDSADTLVGRFHTFGSFHVHGLTLVINAAFIDTLVDEEIFRVT